MANSLIEMYVKFVSLEEVRELFDKMPQQDVFPWTMMLVSYVMQKATDEV